MEVEKLQVQEEGETNMGMEKPWAAPVLEEETG